MLGIVINTTCKQTAGRGIAWR